MEDRYLQTVYRVVAHVTGYNVTALRPDTRFSDILSEEEQFHEIYEECCAALDVPLAGIINSMPMYRQKVGDVMLNSWRNLAAFSTQAQALLAKYDVPIEDETMASLAESMRQGIYVSSGKFCPPQNPPRSKTYVLGWTAGLSIASIAVPFAFTLLPCNPVCSDCTLSTWSQMQEMLPVSLGILAFVQAIAFVPGLYGIHAEKTKRPPLPDQDHAASRANEV